MEIDSFKVTPVDCNLPGFESTFYRIDIKGLYCGDISWHGFDKRPDDTTVFKILRDAENAGAALRKLNELYRKPVAPLVNIY